MKHNFLNACTVKLIENQDFVPIRDTQGGFAIYPGLRIMEKRDITTHTILMLIDGDTLNNDQIYHYFENTLQWMKGIGLNESYLFSIIVFETKISTDKLRTIEDAETFIQQNDVKFAGLIVELDQKMALELPGAGFVTGKYQSLLNNLLLGNLSDFSQLPDLETLINQEKPQPVIEEISSKTPATLVLIAINIVIWLTGQFLSFRFGIDYTLAYGIKDVFLIQSGEFWRLITPMFLHSDITHLGANSVSLLIFGQVVERIFGTRKFLFIYFLAGLLGNFVSFAFSDVLSLGASGAVLGIGGSLVYLWRSKPGAFTGKYRQYLTLVFLAFYNIFYGFVRPNIDNFAHIGGFIGGILIAGVVGYKGAPLGKTGRFLLAASFIAALSFCIMWRTIT